MPGLENPGYKVENLLCNMENRILIIVNCFARDNHDEADDYDDGHDVDDENDDGGNDVADSGEW